MRERGEIFCTIERGNSHAIPHCKTALLVLMVRQAIIDYKPHRFTECAAKLLRLNLAGRR
jgi:hypothetical protein